MFWLNVRGLMQTEKLLQMFHYDKCKQANGVNSFVDFLLLSRKQ